MDDGYYDLRFNMRCTATDEPLSIAYGAFADSSERIQLMTSAKDVLEVK